MDVAKLQLEISAEESAKQLAELRKQTLGVGADAKAATDAAAQGMEKLSGSTKKAQSEMLALARAEAEKAKAVGDLAGAMRILSDAAAKLEQGSVQSVRTETMLVKVFDEKNRQLFEQERQMRRAELAAVAHARAQATLLAQTGQYSAAVSVLTAQLQQMNAQSTAGLRIQSQIAAYQRAMVPPVPPTLPPVPTGGGSGGGGFAYGSLMRGAATLVGIDLSVNAVRELVVGAVQADIAMQRMENTFSAVSGSTAAARKEIEFLRNESNRIGVVFVDTAQAFSKFQAATIGTKISASQARDIFIAFSEAGQRLHLGGREMASIFLALEQMASKGVVSMEELRRQLGQYLPGAFNIAASAMGMTTAEFNKAVKAGAVMSEDLLPKLAKRVKEVFPLGEAADQTAASLNRLSNAWTNLMQALGQALPTKGAANELSGFLTKLQQLYAPREGEEAIQAALTARLNRNARTALLGPIGVGYNKISDLFGDPYVDTYEHELGMRQKNLAVAASGQRRDERQRRELMDWMFPTKNHLTDKGESLVSKWIEQEKADEIEGLEGFERQRAVLEARLVKELDQRKKLFEEILAQGPAGKEALMARGVSSLEEFLAPVLYGATRGRATIKRNEDDAAIEEMQKWLDEDAKQKAKAAEIFEREQQRQFAILSGIDARGGADAKAEAVSRVNAEYERTIRDLQSIALLEDANSVKTEEYARKAAANRDRELSQIEVRFERYKVGEGTMLELLKQRRALERELLDLENTDADPAAVQATQRRLSATQQAIGYRMRSGRASGREGFDYGVGEVEDEWGNAAQRMVRIGRGTASALDTAFTDTFTKMVMQMKFTSEGFHQMSTSIIADIVRMSVQEGISRPIATSILSGIGGLFGGFGGGAAATADTSWASDFHSGGVVGAGFGATRTVGSGAFAFAPRFHAGGPVGDEVPVVARRGEGIFTPEQMASLGKALHTSNRGSSVQILNTFDMSEVDRYLAANPHIILNVIGKNSAQVTRLLT